MWFFLDLKNDSKKREKLSLECIVHYPDQRHYSDVKELSDRNKDKITKAKVKRMQEGSSHLHYNQCSTIPGQFVEGIYGIHLESCYKRCLFCFRVDCFG